MPGGWGGAGEAGGGLGGAQFSSCPGNGTSNPGTDHLLDQLVRENGLTPYYINDAERQDREAAREWLNEGVFDWTLPEHEIQLASEG